MRIISWILGAILGFSIGHFVIQMRLVYLTNEIYRECSVVNSEEATRVKWQYHDFSGH